ncbi:class I SAM-dependent methyltransferase [Hoeflea ulvae]|uniref:Class I SAM-dependent methyltransferase n=1 Tax=Hoeflea ulvae TaxID=2983764 RepID=A0ABT3YCV6_9HYPH|nr:class I SAM-dependent methyltransferase [Hoeflea ulvae]MCY0093718.1 class I SAM-dependent methyltransferase [Hoeflea ulvae]
MSGMSQNYGLRDEIKAYWSLRAESFDSQPGHEIFSEPERAAWHQLIIRHLGPGEQRRVLDLASGTGVVAHLLDDLGFEVTGMDWAEPMLARARAKARLRERPLRFLMGDAEKTMEPDNSYDVITNRHLVWTLVDPEAAFAEWLRVLKPGGQLLIVDGDFVNSGLPARLANAVARAIARLRPGASGNAQPATMMETHNSILSRVYFSGGARAEAVVALLARAGFENIVIDTDMRAIHRAQKNNFPFLKRIERATQHRYAICASKPAGKV